jgi:adenine-specific DNA-methyltransferase
MDALFGDPRMPLSQQVNAYQHRNNWVNRLILGDSLVVMNSLLRFEDLPTVRRRFSLSDVE